MANCLLCGRVATDPSKGPSRWARAVVDDDQVLICPECQDIHPDWTDRATACPVCGSKKLSKTLGDLVCRSCAHQWSLESFTLD